MNVDVRAAIDQIQANTALDADAFNVDVPADAKTVTIEQLREAGPLRGQ